MNSGTDTSGSRKAVTAEQLRQYEETGLLFLRAAIAVSDVARMREHLWKGLAELCQLQRDDPQTWPTGSVNHMQRIQGAAFAPMGSPSLCATLDAIFGLDGWQRPSRWGDLLVRFPMPGAEWKVPNEVWHFDLGGPSWTPIAVIFAFLETTLPGGGGTPVVAGSHRLLKKLAGVELQRISSPRARFLFTRTKDTWINGLWSRDIEPDRTRRYMEEGAEVQGVQLKVAEICGAAGDVVIMHPHMLHSVGVNSRTTPRIVLKQCIYRAAVKNDRSIN